MKVLVIGGTGVVGSQVVNELRKRDVEISVLTRSEEKVKELPEGVKGIVGDVLKPDNLRSIFNGIDRVFMVNPVGYTETSEGLFAVNGARMAGVKRFVYMSVHKLDSWIHLPHFGSKLPIELALKESGMEYTILRPNNFFQNDFWFQQPLMEYNVYPQPIGDKGLSRIDVADIAEAAAVALTEDGHTGQTYNLVGSEVLNGEKTAQIWSDALDKEIKYGGNDLDAWEKQFLQFLPDWMVFDFKLMYESFQKDGFIGTDEDLKKQTKLLGHAPRKFADFAKQTAGMWKKQG